jgi:type II secretory pathway component PulK
MSRRRIFHNDRGVALLIVLLVTALLIALIFEFTYGTRMSLRAAVNFRDSQRAYFLARSGVNAVGMYLSDHLKNNRLQQDLEMREPWPFASLIPGNDITLDIRWEDEGGKLNINLVSRGSEAYTRLGMLFGLDRVKIDQQVLETIADNHPSFRLQSELHQVLSEEEFIKVQDFVTVGPQQLVDINTASPEVLQSLGMSSDWAERIANQLQRNPSSFDEKGKVTSFFSNDPSVAGMANKLDVKSNIFKVHSVATVGGYTKKVEAIITRSAAGFSINYWSVK